MNKIILDIINKQLDGNAYDLLSQDEYELLGYWLAAQEDKGAVEVFKDKNEVKNDVLEVLYVPWKKVKYTEKYWSC